MATMAGSQVLIDIDVDQEVVLASLREFHREQVRRDQGMVLLALQWARLNPGLQRTWPDGSPNLSEGGVDPEELLWEELAAKGCPHMDDMAIPAFADSAGLSEFQARKLIRESLLLVHLLPRVWDQVSRGQIEVWRGRILAQECWKLTPQAVDYVDRLMSLTTARHTQAGREGVIREARLRYMAEVVREEEELAKEARDVQVCTQEWGSTGVASVWGVLDVPDALDLEAAIASGARALKELGSDAPLKVRRSWALGDIARAANAGRAPTLALDTPERPKAPVFHPECACSGGLRPPGAAPPPGPARVMMYLHLGPDSFAHPHAESPPEAEAKGMGVPANSFGVVRVQGPGIPRGMTMTSQTVRSWLRRPTAVQEPKIVFRPVIDLTEHQHVEAYEVPDRLKEHTGLRDGGCVFPWCNRPARITDCDHIIAWKDNGEGGPTCTCNLAPLCRGHHRAKTHADNHTGNRYTWWNYESLGEGKYLWTGPKGSRLLRTNAGVFDITTEHLSSGPRTPNSLLPPRRVSQTLPADVLERIRASLPTTDPAPGEAGELEFPKTRRGPRRRSWLHTAPGVDNADDPPNVKPGSLADRVLRKDLTPPTPFLKALGTYRTRIALFSTPKNRTNKATGDKQPPTTYPHAIVTSFGAGETYHTSHLKNFLTITNQTDT